MRNRFRVVVESRSAADSLVRLRCGRGRLQARPWPGADPGARAEVAVRPEDVLLAADPPGRVSARNVLPGRVARLRTVPEGVEVSVDASVPLVALLTRGAVRDLGLARGAPVFALVKASAVRPLAGARARVRASVVGRRGVVPATAIALLRAVAETGSLRAAAKAERIAYRTAWLRVERARRAWGAPLLESRTGGRGGGGALLTAGGRAVLEIAERAERA
jgi:molybdate transport repressor ModE-like protein/molybdopterin-binding protein